MILLIRLKLVYTLYDTWYTGHRHDMFMKHGMKWTWDTYTDTDTRHEHEHDTDTNVRVT